MKLTIQNSFQTFTPLSAVNRGRSSGRVSDSRRESNRSRLFFPPKPLHHLFTNVVIRHHRAVHIGEDLRYKIRGCFAFLEAFRNLPRRKFGK